MLADPRATEALVDNFAAQWLNLRRVEEVVVDPERYPNYDLSLLQAFQQETELFVGSTRKMNLDSGYLSFLTCFALQATPLRVSFLTDRSCQARPK